MELLFRQLPDNEMERPPTQRDQFDNDDVELVDALVREAIQNSLDARDPNHVAAVQVCFDIKRVEGEKRAEVLDFLRAEQLNRHLAATALPKLDISNDLAILTVEDFGTTGLTGSWQAWDEQPFCDFWRRMGRSHKGGQALGRWGLGKLVFSSSSQARVFLGLTVRREQREALLMGQAVLTHHALDDGKRLDSHGFYAVEAEGGFQLPMRNSAVISSFKKMFGLRRTDEPGLSIVVPALRDHITADRVAKGVLRNYFFPVLFGRLEIHVGELIINKDSFAKMAERLDSENFSGGSLASFIQEMKATRDTGNEIKLILSEKWSAKNSDMEQILGAHIESMREQFNSGSMIAIRAPLLLKRKNGEEVATFVDAFLKRAPTDHQSLFVRNAIVLNAEQKYFKAHKTFGALVADDKAISEFLGDAENPAHTGWSASAEKVAGKWRNAADRLRDIRHLLRRLHNTLVSAVETLDKDALVDVFSLPSDDGATGTAPKGSVSKKPIVPSIDRTPPSYHLVRLADGFKIKAAAIDEDQLPIQIRVRTAYDVIRGNPFRKHNSADFDFTTGGVKREARGATVLAAGANSLTIDVTECDFEVDVFGFDTNRDLIIDVERFV